MNEENFSTSSVKISDEVISIISGVAAGEVEGVYSMGGSLASGIAEFLGAKKNISKGIKVDMKDNIVSVEIHIIVVYGVRIPDVAWKIQEKVKESLESLTGLTVEKVNVHIDGVNIDKSEKISEEPISASEDTENIEE